MVKRSTPMVWTAALVAAAGAARGLAMEPDAPQPAPVAAPAPETSTPQAIRFSFRDAPLDQVVEFFARQIGLPVIRETDVPEGKLTFISDNAYPVEEALRVLNTILQTRGVMLRQDQRFLYIQKLENMKAEAVPTFKVGDLPDSITDDQIVSVVITLKHAMAKGLAEQLGGLVAPYGALVALPQQNAVIITETAAQCRRLSGIIEALDSRPAFEESVKVFPLKHVRSEDVLASLKVLVAEKKSTVVIDQQGNRRTIQDEELTGVRLEADQRTNSIISVGATGRLTTIESLIALLDVPESQTLDSGRKLGAFGLTMLDANEAAGLVRGLFAALPEDRRPVLVPLPGAQKLALMASPEQLEQARALLEEAESRAVGGASPSGGEQVVSVVDLKHIQPNAAVEVLNRLSSPRQQRLVKLAAAPSGQGVVINGPADDVRAIESMIAQIDRPIGDSREDVRILSLKNADANEVAAAVSGVYDHQPGTRPTVRVDRASNSLIVRATPEQLKTIESLAERLDGATLASGRSLRTIAIDRSKADAGEIAETVRRLLERQQGVKVRIIDAQDLIKQEESAPPATPPAADAPESEHSELDEWPEWDADPAEDIETARNPILLPGRLRLIIGYVQVVTAAVEPDSDEADITLAVDPATNSLIIIGSSRGVDRVAELATLLQQQLPAEPGQITIITLPAGADPQALTGLLNQTIGQIGRANNDNPGGLTGRVAIIPDPVGNGLIVSANQTDMAVVQELVGALARPELAELPVRSLKLERADAQTVASALQRFFDDRARASARPGARAPARRVAVVGDRRTSTLIVAASDEDWAQVGALVETFDAPTASRDLQFRVIPLQHARVADVQPLVEELAGTLQWFNFVSGQGRRDEGGQPDTVLLRADQRTNSIIVIGHGESFETVERLVATIDTPRPEKAEIAVRVFKVERAELAIVRRAAEQALGDPGRQQRWWEPPDPMGLRFETDTRTRSLVAIGPKEKLDAVAGLVEQLDGAAGDVDRKVELVGLTFANAGRTADSLNRFFNDRAVQAGIDRSPVSIIGSSDGNTLIVTAPEGEMDLLRDIVARLDQPDAVDGREIEVVSLRHGSAPDIARAMQQLFPRTDAASRVVVQPDVRTNSIVVSAPRDLAAQVNELISQMDRPPEGAPVLLRTFTLKSARADEVARTLREALELTDTATGRARELQGDVRRFVNDEGEPIRVRARVTPDRRSNSLLVSADEPSLGLVAKLIAQLDEQPAQSGVEYRVIALQHTVAADLSSTVRSLWRRRPQVAGEPEPAITFSSRDNTLIVSATAEQFEELDRILKELDVPSRVKRTTEFVALEHANAQQAREALGVFYGRFAFEATTPGARGVTIVADPASNSLVISAEEAEWPGIRELLSKLDSEEYDASRQLEVIALEHADARSVATAIQQAFDAPLRAQLEREREEQRDRARRRGDDPFFDAPPVLINSDEVVSVSPEPLTNSIVVSAGKRNMERIRAIVTRLDVPDFARLPEPRVVPLKAGRASELAASLRQMYELSESGRGQGRSPRSVVIVGDDASNALIIRAEEPEMARIMALASAIQQEGMLARVQVRVMPLSRQPAARLAQTILRTFAASAQQNKEPLAVEADRRTNALVIASSQRLYDEIEKVVRELDGAPGDAEGDPARPIGLPNQGLFIIDINNTSPEEVRRLLEQMGVTREQPADRPGLVGDPVTIVPLTTRRAVAVLASPADGPTIIDLVKAVDAAPILPDHEMAIVQLKTARAAGVVATLERLLNPDDNDAKTRLAAALTEQVRRLGLRANDLDSKDIQLDLTVPLRVQAEEQSNAVVVVSTPANIAAVRELVGLLDRLPAGDAVVIRIFHLNNAGATRMSAVIRELFARGEALRRVPGTDLRGQPTTESGRALAGEIAVSVDERTNALIVAGREEAVALVEVLIGQLDADESAKWIEPRLIQLRFADSVKLAELLRRVLVEGATDLPQSAAIREQIGRLRVLRTQKPGDPAPAGAVASDVFTRLTQLRILPEENLNALIVVGSTANVEAVEELVAMLDVEAASRFGVVRLYPLKFAAADRVGGIVQGLFRQQRANNTIRDEDDVVVQTDERTNTLVVATSARSFAVIENLLLTLDSEGVHSTVGLHVISAGRNDARQLAPKIERLMRDRLSAISSDARSDRDIVSIQADEATNTLIVAASDENLTIIKQMVELLAAGEFDAGQRMEIVTLRSARAQEMAALLDELYVREELRTRGQGALRVRPDERLNALIVNGTERDITRIRELVDRLDAAALSAVREIRIIPLKSSNALEMVSLLDSVLSGRPVGGARGAVGRQATILRFARQAAEQRLEEKGAVDPTEADISAGIREQVTLTPDVRTNSIIAAAPTQMMLLIEALIEDLEASAAGSRQIEIFSLVNADAEQTGELLRDLFNLRQQGNLYVLVPSGLPDDPAQTPDATLPGVGDMRLSVVPDERQQLAITIDARTNSLLVSGTPEYLSLVRDVVGRLDAQVGEERQQITMELRNARVDEVSAALQTFVTQEQQRISQVMGPDRAGSLVRRLEKEISVVGVPGSSRLILSASPRYMDKVVELVKELDRPPAQVLIQVLLAEVTLDTESAWGVDFTLLPQGSNALAGSFLAAGSGVLTALGVPNFSVSTLDFELLVRALEVQGRLDVLSRPQILVNDNEDAEINVGEEIQLVTNIERSDTGRVVSDVTPRNVGVILTVTPSISPDGYVRLDIAPEISAVSARTTQISEDFEAPIISQRKAETTVTVRDGQTIVIGGLIQNRGETRKTKVPFIGDIPILGIPFRSEKTTTTKTELLIILTPRVIASDRDLRRVTDEELDRLSLPDDVKEAIRHNNVSGQTTMNGLPKKKQSAPKQIADEPPAWYDETDEPSESPLPPDTTFDRMEPIP